MSVKGFAKQMVEVEPGFRCVTIHTAKCDICEKRNTDVMRRCMSCTWSICTPCYEAVRHDLHHGNCKGFYDSEASTIHAEEVLVYEDPDAFADEFSDETELYEDDNIAEPHRKPLEEYAPPFDPASLRNWSPFQAPANHQQNASEENATTSSKKSRKDSKHSGVNDLTESASAKRTRHMRHSSDEAAGNSSSEDDDRHGRKLPREDHASSSANPKRGRSPSSSDSNDYDSDAENKDPKTHPPAPKRIRPTLVNYVRDSDDEQDSEPDLDPHRRKKVNELRNTMDKLRNSRVGGPPYQSGNPADDYDDEGEGTHSSSEDGIPYRLDDERIPPPRPIQYAPLYNPGYEMSRAGLPVFSNSVSQQAAEDGRKGKGKSKQNAMARMAPSSGSTGASYSWMTNRDMLEAMESHDAIAQRIAQRNRDLHGGDTETDSFENQDSIVGLDTSVLGVPQNTPATNPMMAKAATAGASFAPTQTSSQRMMSKLNQAARTTGIDTPSATAKKGTAVIKKPRKKRSSESAMKAWEQHWSQQDKKNEKVDARGPVHPIAVVTTVVASGYEKLNGDKAAELKAAAEQRAAADKAASTTHQNLVSQLFADDDEMEEGEILD